MLPRTKKAGKHKGKKKRVRTVPLPLAVAGINMGYTVCKADGCTLCMLCCDNPEHKTKSTDLPAKRQRLARACVTMEEGGYKKVPSENKFEFEDTSRHAGRPREETLYQQKLQQTLTTTLESTPLVGGWGGRWWFFISIRMEHGGGRGGGEQAWWYAWEGQWWGWW